MASFGTLNIEDSQAIRDWVSAEINRRMELANVAVDFINQLDGKVQALHSTAVEAEGRVNQQVAELNQVRTEAVQALTDISQQSTAQVGQLRIDTVEEIT